MNDQIEELRNKLRYLTYIILVKESIKEWFVGLEDKVSIEDLIKMVEDLKSESEVIRVWESYKRDITISWVTNSKIAISGVDLKKALIGIERPIYVIDSWIYNPHNTISGVDLSMVLALVDSEEGKASSIESWISESKTVVSTLDLKESLTVIESVDLKRKIIVIWHLEFNKAISIDDIKKILTLVQHDLEKTKEIDGLIDKIAEGISAEDLKDALMKVEDDFVKMMLINTWINNSKLQVSGDDINKLLLGVVDVSYKENISKNWIKNSNLAISGVDLSAVLTNFGHLWDQKDIMFYWINNSKLPISGGDLRVVLSYMPYESNKVIIIKKWINNSKFPISNVDLREALTVVVENSNKKELILYFMNITNVDINTKYKYFLEFAQAGIFDGRFDVEGISEAFSKCNLPTNKSIDLCKDLYLTNEWLQVELFKELKVFDKETIKNFAKTLQSNDLILSILEYGDLYLSEEDKQEIKHKKDSENAPSTHVLDSNTSEYIETTAEMKERWKKNPIPFYNELQDIRNKHIFDGYSPYDFPYPVIAPTLQEIQEFIDNFNRNLGSDKNAERLIRGIYDNKFSDLRKRIEECQQGIKVKQVLQNSDNYEIDPSGKEKYVKYPYEKTLEICEEFVEILDYIHRYQYAKAIVDNSEFLPTISDSERARLKKELNKVKDEQTLKEFVDGTLNDILSHQDINRYSDKISYKFIDKMHNKEQNNQLTRIYLPSKDSDKYTDQRLPQDLLLILPLTGALDEVFFNNVRVANIFPVAISFEPVVRADGINMSTKEFRDHDLFHINQQLKFQMQNRDYTKSFKELSELGRRNLELIVKEFNKSQDQVTELVDKNADLFDNESDLFEKVLFLLVHEHGLSLMSLENWEDEIKKYISNQISVEGIYNTYFKEVLTQRHPDRLFGDKVKNKVKQDTDKMMNKILSIVNVVQKSNNPIDRLLETGLFAKEELDQLGYKKSIIFLNNHQVDYVKDYLLIVDDVSLERIFEMNQGNQKKYFEGIKKLIESQFFTPEQLAKSNIEKVIHFSISASIFLKMLETKVFTSKQLLDFEKGDLIKYANQEVFRFGLASFDCYSKLDPNEKKVIDEFVVAIKLGAKEDVEKKLENITIKNLLRQNYSLNAAEFGSDEIKALVTNARVEIQRQMLPASVLDNPDLSSQSRGRDGVK